VYTPTERLCSTAELSRLIPVRRRERCYLLLYGLRRKTAIETVREASARGPAECGWDAIGGALRSSRQPLPCSSWRWLRRLERPASRASFAIAPRATPPTSS